MIDLLYYKKKYFKDNIFITTNQILDDLRNNGLKNNKKASELVDYSNLNSIELIKLVSDKIFFFNNNDSNSIKNMLYGNNLIYQDFNKVEQLESYLYRLINESINRTLIFVGNFSNKNSYNRISKESINELIKNMDNNIIYLSDQIILIRYQIYLSLLWECRNKPFDYLKTLPSYKLKNKWDFSN
tara:strand:- start:503 stop:1057 length:555 start_codon:yes stop_codon:yes gene_type:complete